MNTQNTSTNRILFWLGFVALIALSYWWRLKVLNVFPFDYDEGIHLIIGQLWAAGYAPYREIFVSYPPSFLWSLGIPWKLFSAASALQLLMTSYALAGVVAVVYLGSVYNGRLAGLATGLFLSFIPAYFLPSFTIMTEVPSISMAVVAIACAEKYRRDGGWYWLLLTGAVLGFGLSLKILPYYAGPLVLLLILTRPFTEECNSPIRTTTSNENFTLTPSLARRGEGLYLRELAILGIGFVLTFFVPLLFFDISALYDQVFGMRLVSRVVEANPFESNQEYIIEFLFGNAGLFALALYGLIFVVARKLQRYWPFVVWLALVWVSMLLLVPLRDKHLPIFLPIVALLAGFGLSHMVAFLTQIKQQHLSPQLVSMLLTIVFVLGLLGWQVPQVIAKNNGQAFEFDVNEERQVAIAFIDKIATPDDCVIADNPVFLYQTRRLPPPQLAETSQTRIDTGFLTFEDVVNAIEAHKCHVVAIVTPRFGESLPQLAGWLAERYLGLHAQSETFVYFAPKNNLMTIGDNITKIEGGTFGDMVRLQGVSFNKREGAIFVSLLWELQSAIDSDYIEQITLKDDAGNVVYQFNRPPFEGRFNPTTWQPGEQVRDTFRLDMPADVADQSLHLYLALCTPETGQCLPVSDQTQDELYLGEIQTQP